MTLADDRWPPSTLDVLLNLRSGQPVGVEAVEWGTSALAAGFDSPALRLLAGLDLEGAVRSADAKPLLETALTEVGVPPLGFEEVARRYLRQVAEAVVRGDLAPRTAADLVHGRVISPLKHPKDLMPWCYVWEGNAADLSRQLQPQEEDAEIVKVARKFLETAV